MGSRGLKSKVRCKIMVKTCFRNFSSRFPVFFPGFLKKFPEFSKTSGMFLDIKKCPEKKVLEEVLTGKFSYFHLELTPNQVVGQKVDLGQKRCFGVFEFFAAQPIVTPADFGAKSTGSTFCIHTASILFR